MIDLHGNVVDILVRLVLFLISPRLTNTPIGQVIIPILSNIKSKKVNNYNISMTYPMAIIVVAISLIMTKFSPYIAILCKS